MLRTIALAMLGLLVQPLGAQQEAVNPFKIVLGNSTVAALKSNPKGLVWPFDSLGVNSHDGVTVYFDPSETLVTSWKANDGTMQNLFSLDVTDDILNQIENDYGLPALINPSDRERIRGVLLRYVPPAGAALPPNPAVGPIGLPNSASGLNPATSDLGNSVLDNHRVTSNVNAGSQAFRPLGGSGTPQSSLQTGPLGSALGSGPASGSDFYQTRPAPLQPQMSDFSATRPAFPSGGSASPTGSSLPQGGGIAPPPLSQPLANQAAGDRFAFNQQLLPPPVYNSNASPNGIGGGAVGANGFGATANWQAMQQQEAVQPNRRPTATQFPQVSYNHFPDNQAAGYPGFTASAGGGMVQPQLGPAGQLAAGSPDAASVASWQTERQALTAELAESKQRSVFLLFMLFLLTGLCLYLSWLARGFYFRYAELADELRETFSATG